TWSRTSWLRANSTERSWSTFAPLADSSSISSYVTAASLRAFGTRRGSAVKTPSTSVYISHAVAPSAAASATAVRFEPPRPSVVTSCESAETPWKPATRTILPASRASLIRVARTSAIFALPWTVSVTIPACEPVSEIASCPRSWTAIAQSAFEIRSPTEMSMSYSRGCGFGEISWASRISSSVVSPIAERTPTTPCPSSRARTSRRATSLILSGSATDVPPNFMTTRSRRGESASAVTSGTVSSTAMREVCLRHFAPARERPAERHLVGVLEVAAGGKAAREACDADAVAQPAGEIRRGRLAGRVRVRREDDLDDAVALDAVQELVDPQILGLDAVERGERAAEDVVEAAVLRGPLERDEVDGLLDDADRRAVAARVEADRAELLLGEVAALAAEADALLHLADRRRERERLLLRHLEDVEGEPLRRPAADPRQARQLGDEVLDGRAEHGRRVLVRSGRKIQGWPTPSPGS